MGKTLEAVAREWLAVQCIEHRTAENYASRLEHAIVGPLVQKGRRKLSQLRLADLEALLAQDWQRYALSTRRGLLGTLRAFLRWSADHGYCKRDLPELLREPRAWRRRGKRSPVQVLSRDDAKLLISAARTPYRAVWRYLDRRPHAKRVDPSKVLYPALVTSLMSGIRIGTLVLLRWQFLDLQAGRAVLPGDVMKSGRPFSLPLHWDVLEVLRDLQRRTAQTRGRLPVPQSIVIPTSPSNLRKLLRRTMARAGLTIPGFRWHHLRYTFASWMAALAPETVVRELLDHAPGTITQRYSQHLDVKTLAQWVALLPSILPTARQPELWQQA